MLNKTVEQLDGQDWGEPSYPSHLVTECHRLRRVPLKEFTVENLRIMIGQHIGLDWLVPLALTRLYDEPFADGDYYEGDLLNAVLRLPDAFGKAIPTCVPAAASSSVAPLICFCLTANGLKV